MHLALIGDSTFDNAAYTGGGPAVVAHLNGLMGDTGHATLLAVDGATIAHVETQLRRLDGLRAGTDPVTHIALSAGGNDLLMEIDVLGQPAGTVAEGLLAVRERALRFGRAYRTMLDDVARLDLPLVICTVYAGAFPDPVHAATIEIALRIFDHEILEAAADLHLPVVDLRRVCSAPADYFNAIEPGEQGGAKIAAAVLAALPPSPAA